MVEVLAMLVMMVMAALVIGAQLFFIRRFYLKVAPGEALVISKTGPEGPVVVSFTSGLVVPVVHRAERLDLTARVVRVERRGADGLLTQGRERVDIVAAFTLLIPRTAEDVLLVANRVGCARANDPEVIAELFAPRFVDALETVAQHRTPDALFADRDAYRDDVLHHLGRELDGFRLEDIAIELLERTPIRDLDPRREGFPAHASV